MRALLLGPVLDELAGLLPRGGLERRLEELAGQLGDDQPAATPGSAAVRTEPARPVATLPGRNRQAQEVTGVRTTPRPVQPATSSELQGAERTPAASDSVTL